MLDAIYFNQTKRLCTTELVNWEKRVTAYGNTLNKMRLFTLHKNL